MLVHLHTFHKITKGAVSVSGCHGHDRFTSNFVNSYQYVLAVNCRNITSIGIIFLAVFMIKVGGVIPSRYSNAIVYILTHYWKSIIPVWYLHL